MCIKTIKLKRHSGQGVVVIMSISNSTVEVKNVDTYNTMTCNISHLFSLLSKWTLRFYIVEGQVCNEGLCTQE